MDCAQQQLPRELAAVGVARHWVSDYCAHALGQDQRQVLELLTSEVVANAVLHGTGDLTVAVAVGRAPGHVIVAVSDGSPDLPTLKTVGPEATGGRGVALVDVLSQGWGCEPDPPGKRVWFTLTEQR